LNQVSAGIIVATWSCKTSSIVCHVNQLLKSDWISIESFEFFISKECDVFKAVNLSEGPENVISVLADSLDLPLALELWINRKSFSQSVEHLGFGEWT